MPSSNAAAKQHKQLNHNFLLFPPSSRPTPNIPLTALIPILTASRKGASLLAILICILALFQTSCRSARQQYTAGPDLPPRAVVKDGVAITLRDQKLTVFRGGKKVKDYSISSSKFGIGSTNGSHRTPLGIHAVTKKVGEGQPEGMVFKACRPTGEVVGIDAKGRDPIVTRVIQIAGLEGFNKNSHSRRIYIHGTPEERNIGRPASYGCIRMRSSDVMDLYPRVYRGMPVAIESCSQEMYIKAENSGTSPSIAIPKEIVAKLPTDDVSFRPTKRKLKSRRYNRSRYASNRSKGKASKKRFAQRKTGKSNKRVASTGSRKKRR